MRFKSIPLIISFLLLLCGLHSAGFAQSTLPVRVDRWLEVQSVSGTVTFYRDQTSQAAKVGVRFGTVGDTLITGKNSSATLGVDTGIGTVQMSESTTLQVKKLEVLPSGGMITLLNITEGQVRLQLRSFTNSESELEIQTPAGISGVRGTIFGVSVQPNGTTGIATLEGQVVAEAQGQAVAIAAGLQSLIVVGEPPTQPTALQENTQLNLRSLNPLDDRTVEIVGQIDRVNLLVIEDEVQNIEPDGTFTLQRSLPRDRRIRATVTTPLGKKQAYEIIVP
ncbi:MAG: FecR domain-containing protein [Leptolyngbyaceae cyanobacterium CSU_1_4]|nr:FecR domain-containing protein [Leptolyngbyaceae cyanobacterium CSU_1_4]